MFRQPFWKPLTLAVGAFFLAACGGPAEPTPIYATPWTVAGTVWLYGPAGIAKAQDGTVAAWVEHRTGRAETTGPIRIGADGRYQFTVAADTSRVRVQRSDALGYQPCAVTLESANQVPADLHVVADTNQLGANVPGELTSKAPTLSGVVYEMTAQGQRPVPRAWVLLDGLRGLGLVIADTLTDDNGHYILCGVPFLPNLVLQAAAPGFELGEITFENLIGKTTVDIEMKRR